MTIPNAPEPPILVTDATTATAIWTAVRYALTAVGGFFVHRGALGADTLEMLLGVAGVVVPNLVGTLLSIRNKNRLIAAAASADDRVAQVV